MSLYAHQENILAYRSKGPGFPDENKCGLFLGTGSGKTKIALLLSRGDILVIAPKTQVQDRNWEREYLNIAKEEVANYKKSQPIKTFKPRLTVMSKEEFRRDAHSLERFHTVIVDEAHTCLGMTPNIRWRNKKPIPKSSQLYEALEAYIARTKPDKLYLCTATIVKSPFTVFAAAQLVGRKWDFYKFREEFYTRLPMPGREVWTPKRSSAVKDKLANLVRSIGHVGRLEDFFDVPEQTFKTIYVELTAKQKARVKDLPLEYPDPLVLLGKKHQVENGVLAGDEFNLAENFENEKISRILDLAAEFPRMIVFAKYKAQIVQIATALFEEGYFTWELTGDTKDRGGVIKQAGEMDGVLIVQAQISAGWEVKPTPVMVFASRSYSYVDYVQALGRIQRADAIKKNLYINLVVKDGVDEAVDEALTNKQDFDERLYLKL